MMALDTFINELKKGRKTILFFTVGFFGFSLLYCVFLFRPTYLSESKVLIEEVSPTTFVTELGKERRLETNSSEKNPILTQIEILSSRDMAERVYGALVRSNSVKALGPKAKAGMVQRIQSALKLKTPPATDIIELKASWNEPEMAYNLNQAFLDEYREYNISANKASVSQAKKYIKEQLDRTQLELQQTRDRIRNFKKSSSSVDLNAEAGSIVKEVADTQNAISALNGQISYHQGKVSEYSSKLHVSPGNVRKALNSVALGQNESLNALHKELSDAEQQYASWRVRYPDTTKKMSSLREHINEIKSQIRDQVATTVGQNVDPGSVVIKDSVRTQLVNNMVDSQAEALSLRAQRQSLQKQLSQLQVHQHKIPDMQVTLSELVDREVSLASIANALNSKLVEASVRESEIISNINVVQVPTLPTSASFPTVWHVMLVMSILGAAAGSLTVLGRYYLLDMATDASEIENLLNLPVYGRLSWVSDNVYHGLSGSQPISELQSLEYQRIVTALRVKHEDDGVNVIGFSSTADDSSRSNITSSIARLLSKCNYSVLLVDADFRSGTVAQEFGLNSGQLPDFKELLTGEQFWQQGAQSGNSHIEPYITKLENEKSLYLMTKGESGANPYELVTSKFFPLMIAQVKSKFDFVLVDMPPILETSDSLIISRFLDGLVTICGLNSSRAKLKTVRKLCDDNSVNLIGAIAKSGN